MRWVRYFETWFSNAIKFSIGESLVEIESINRNVNVLLWIEDSRVEMPLELYGKLLVLPEGKMKKGIYRRWFWGSTKNRRDT